MQKEVTHLTQVDVGAGPPGEVLERGQAARTQRDVDRVGELRPHSPGRLGGGSTREVPSLEQQHIGDACLSEMERGAGAHHATADDDDLRGFLAHPKFTPCASGSDVE